jgi:uncharacterized protein YcbK (DUF882 family)
MVSRQCGAAGKSRERAYMPLMHLRRRELLIASGVWLTMSRATWAQPSAGRRLCLTNANTGETFDGPYRDGAGPDANAMIELAVFLRDHHANKTGPVDLDMLDFLADVMDAIGQQRATVLSAYRTPETNAMLATRYFGVAEKSQHLLGRAVDVYFDRKLADAEKAALAMNRGGVGWYPNSHFIHLDSGPVRHWELEEIGLEAALAGHGPHRLLTVRERLRLYHELARQRLQPYHDRYLQLYQEWERRRAMLRHGP